MKFSEFKESLSNVKKIPLAGEIAHREMLPEGREQQIKESEMTQNNPLKAGVMALFYPNMQQETMLILILRKTYKGVHSGQIGFPGGREEIRDTDLTNTALRETYEEIGVRPNSVKVVKELSRIYIPASNFYVYPYLGYCKSTPRFKRQESEVEELLPIRLEDFMNDDNVVTQNLTTSYTGNIDVPAFAFGDKIVWGATAMMLNEVKSLLKEAL